MKKFLIITLLFALSISAVPAMAQESEASEESLKQRLQRVIDEKSDQIKGITDGQEKRGFIGTLKRVSEESITVDGPKGTVIIPVQKDLAILQGNAPLAINAMEIDAQVVLIGYQKNDDFEARRILVLKAPLVTVNKSVSVGNITKIDKTSVSITTRTGDQKIYEVTSTMVVENNQGETIKLADIEEAQDVLIISTPVEESTRKVKDSAGKMTRIRLLAATAEVESEKEVVTPTVTPKVTTKPAATKAPTKTPTP